MKDWQKGYELDYLKSLEPLWQKHNELAMSPFASFKKNNIAAALDEKTLVLYSDNGGKYVSLGYTIKQVKVPSEIQMLPGVSIGKKLKGECVISNIGILPGEEDLISTYLEASLHNKRDIGLWMYIWEEDENFRNVMFNLGFRKIGVKFNTFASIQGVYYRDSENGVNWFDDEMRKFPKIDKYEKITINKLGLQWDRATMDTLSSKLKDEEFKNHYSNYNKSKSWSAIALRGYSSDPLVIEKPSEMNDKWHEAHKGETFELQDTTLMPKFKRILNPILKEIPGKKHRIRFMKLRANNEGNSELGRHTDLVDADSGIRDGQLARVHIPIITNPQVQFMSWGCDAKCKAVNPKVGETWVLDTRKPHRVVNGGVIDRVHLVIDVESSPEFRKMIKL